jgi:hypothetical protein
MMTFNFVFKDFVKCASSSLATGGMGVCSNQTLLVFVTGMFTGIPHNCYTC